MSCKHCGFHFSGEANYCPGCGKKVSDEGSCGGCCSFGKSKQQKILLSVILAVLAILALLYFFGSAKEEGELIPPSKNRNQSLAKTDEVFNSLPLQNSIEGFMSAVTRNEVKKAYENTAEDFRKTTSLEDFEIFVKNNPAFLNFETVVLEKLDFDNNMAILTGKLVAEDKKNYPVQYHLLEENGNWKVVHVQIMKMKENAG